MDQYNDILGRALSAFYFNGDRNNLWVLSDKMENDEMHVDYYFRDYNKMPEIEKQALKKCKGRVLDVGAGAGSHALWLQNQKVDVTALDISKGCIKVMKGRGIKQVIEMDLLAFKSDKFDTILLLMNGIGISKSIENLSGFLTHLKSLLNKNGQVLFDSADLKYLYTDDDGSMLIDLNGPYYGEMDFRFAYNNELGNWFKWLYIDEYLMKDYADKTGFDMEVLYRGESSNYLGRLTLKK